MTDDNGSFDERLRSAQQRQQNERPVPASDKAGTASPMGIGVRVGVELVAAMAVSVGIGWALDRWLGTTPWLIGLFVLLGGAAGERVASDDAEGAAPGLMFVARLRDWG